MPGRRLGQDAFLNWKRFGHGATVQQGSNVYLLPFYQLIFLLHDFRGAWHIAEDVK